MQVQGTIKLIGLTEQISQSFQKRDVVITTDEQYPQHILVQFAQKNCDLLNTFQVGQQVVIDINLRGREWQNQQGQTQYFNTIQGWRIAPLQMQQQPQPQQQQFQQQAPQQQQQQQYQQNNGGMQF